MIGNYAAVLCAWKLLCEFLDIPTNQGGFVPDLLQEMNGHVVESSKDREPWVWILEIILGEIDAGNYKYPYKFEKSRRIRDDDILFIPFHPHHATPVADIQPAREVRRHAGEVPAGAAQAGALCGGDCPRL